LIFGLRTFAARPAHHPGNSSLGYGRVRLYTLETQIAGAWAFERGITRGKNIWRNGKEPTKFAHKYLMVLKHQPNGELKIARLIWNNNSTE
jgi:ketosteroid isomerase-like protein